MLNGAGETNTIYTLIIFIIGNIFLCLFFINRFFEQKKINNRLKASISESPEKIIIKYLQDQFDRTRNKKQFNDINITHDAANLRMAYLRIESKAVEKNIGSDAYWQHLANHIDKLFKIISPLKPTKDTPKDALLNKVEAIKNKFDDIVKQCTDGETNTARTKISDNMNIVYEKIKKTNLTKDQINKYHEKLKILADAFENSELRKPYLTKKSKKDHKKQKESTLDKISEYCEENSATVNFAKTIGTNYSANPKITEKLDNYEKENTRLTRYVNQLKKQLEELHINEIERESSGNTNTAPLESDLNEEIIASNEKEILRLREVVKSQRNALLDLEEITENPNEVDNESLKQYRIEIEQLKRSALDSELCVKMLEDELDNLRESLNQPSSKNDEISTYEVEQLNKELETLKKELLETEEKNHQYSSLLQFVFNALSASSVEDVSLLLHESLSSLHFAPLILVKTEDRIIELFENDTLSVRDKVIISNMQLNEINPKKNGQLIFRLDNITGIITPTSDQNTAEEMHDHVIQILKLSNNVIKQILQTQKNKSEVKKVGSCVGDIKEASFEVDEILDTFIKNTRAILDDSFTLIKSTARAKGLNATQIAALQAIEQDALSQIQSEDTIRPKIRKKFLGIINSIEK